MKIGIITQYYKSLNFGGNLQAFALQKKIEKLGCRCEQICYDRKYRNNLYCLLREVKHSNLKEFIPNIVKVIEYIFTCIISFKDFFALFKRKSIFSFFSDSIPHSNNVYSSNDIENISDKYDIFIVGSDCVWYDQDNSEIYNLQFADSESKKISYAASLGCASIPDGWCEKYLDAIKEFDGISVREKSIAEELQKLIPEKKIHITADPTLLFNADEWNSFLPSNSANKNYALIYILSEDENQCKAAEKWAHAMGLQALVFPHIHNIIHYWQKDYGDIRDFSSGPLEFVSLIKNAEVIITDSFHASVFSTIFHRPFYALIRETEKDFVGRVENFLEDVGLSSQLTNVNELLHEKKLPEPDFSYADKIINQKREESIKYLKENLM